MFFPCAVVSPNEGLPAHCHFLSWSVNAQLNPWSLSLGDQKESNLLKEGRRKGSQTTYPRNWLGYVLKFLSSTTDPFCHDLPPGTSKPFPLLSACQFNQLTSPWAEMQSKSYCFTTHEGVCRNLASRTPDYKKGCILHSFWIKKNLELNTVSSCLAQVGNWPGVRTILTA